MAEDHQNPPVDEFPKSFRYAGIGIGVAMLAGGIVAMLVSAQLYNVSILLICVGFGIVLAAFGSRAHGLFFGANVVGAGATAIVLYLLLYNFPIRYVDSYARGTIEKTSNLQSIVGTGRREFFVGKRGLNDDFRFIVFEKDVDGPYSSFSMTMPKDKNGIDSEISFNCIDSSIFRRAIHNYSDIVFRLRLDKYRSSYQLIDTSTSRPVGRINDYACGAQSSGPMGHAAGLLDFLSVPAMAGDLSSTGPEAISKSIELLDSEDASLRNLARQQLGKATDPAEYQIIAKTWDITKSTYREDLGRLIAWSAAIGRDRANAVRIAESLSPAQLEYLVQLTGQSDYTTRQISTELLHRLLETTSWPAGPSKPKQNDIVKSTLDGVLGKKNLVISKENFDISGGNVVYNSVVALDFASCAIDRTYASYIVDVLSQAKSKIADVGNSPRTVENLNKTISSIRSCGP